MSRVFISHSSKDGFESAHQLAAALEAGGLPCWIAPRDVTAGAPYPDEIVRAIRGCHGLVLLLTPAANRSSAVLQEVERAAHENKRIVTLIVNGTPMSDGLSFFLRVRKHMVWTDAEAAARALAKVFGPTEPKEPTEPTPRANLSELKPGTVFRDWEAGPEMVLLSSGSFVMGSSSKEPGRDPREGPSHTVTINYPLAVAKHPVTRAQWRYYLDSTNKKGSTNGWAWDRALGKSQQHADYSWENPGFQQDGNHPAVCVTWDEAQEYAKWLSEKTGAVYRLLSEAEWEYAARAGTKTAHYWGDEVARSCAHYYGCGSPWDKKGTAPAGSFAPNPWGLYDMLGNVYEWTRDFWNNTYKGAPVDGSAWISGDRNLRVVRGGSWGNDAGCLRVACRSSNDHRDTGDNDQGLRVART